MGRRSGPSGSCPAGTSRQVHHWGSVGDRADHVGPAPTADAWLAAQRFDLARETWKARPWAASPFGCTQFLVLTAHKAQARTADLYQRLLNLHVLPELGDRPLKGLTPAWSAPGTLSSGARPGRRRGRSPTGSCARSSTRLCATGRSPATRADRRCRPTHTAERPAPTLTQVHQLADLVPARYQALVLVAAYGGLRFGELTALTRADVVLGKTGCPCCASESR